MAPDSESARRRTRASPRRSRPRVGLAGALAFLESHVDAGGVIRAQPLAERFGWRIDSAQDCLVNLAAKGRLRKVGTAPRTRETIYELASSPARVKACGQCGEAKGEDAFFLSRSSPDLLTRTCKACIGGNAERDRLRREAARRRP